MQFQKVRTRSPQPYRKVGQSGVADSKNRFGGDSTDRRFSSSHKDGGDDQTRYQPDILEDVVPPESPTEDLSQNSPDAKPRSKAPDEIVYTFTNFSEDRALNVTGTASAELARVLGSLIRDLQNGRRVILQTP